MIATFSTSSYGWSVATLATNKKYLKNTTGLGKA
jgi:hypothetical protein